ncbi:MAG: hypothetical protein ANABAC_2919 [Anaerolineae bacterium]|jgi:selenoprotein W-related protein|nr:MAG: hypothetical protein ANABAC_2919 [Anaerolineae bacterium]
MAEILREFESDIDSITVIPSDGGRFEVTVNGKLIFSKLQTGRHVNQGELIQLIRAFQKGG